MMLTSAIHCLAICARHSSSYQSHSAAHLNDSTMEVDCSSCIMSEEARWKVEESGRTERNSAEVAYIQRASYTSHKTDLTHESASRSFIHSLTLGELTPNTRAWQAVPKLWWLPCRRLHRRHLHASRHLDSCTAHL